MGGRIIPKALVFGLLLKIAIDSDELRGVRGDVATHRDLAGRRRPVYIGGFFPIEVPYFASLPSTVEAAITHVNNLTGILDGFELRMRWNWTQVRVLC